MDAVECAEAQVCDQDLRTAGVQLVTRGGEIAQRKNAEANAVTIGASSDTKIGSASTTSALSG